METPNIQYLFFVQYYIHSVVNTFLVVLIICFHEQAYIEEQKDFQKSNIQHEVIFQICCAFPPYSNIQHFLFIKKFPASALFQLRFPETGTPYLCSPWQN